ncbi:cyclic-phosphate processing receiver domain-containing protein [Ruminococcus sp.]|uniref:cyclic-phosphate processing receiver domain-containing protein n=1 Tax=Ruminococcus sp. TaxID=41978 RepID=UPI0025E4757A|nr:cyclic-phosphate processing receiver domain-containing protein [Ruminococcus sp.]MBQ8965200.1 hypothetical protein [Ruminococcus sp.]
MELKLFADDARPLPAGYECVRSYDDCLMYYRLFGDFSFVSLDYDLGDGHTGLDILIWIKNNGKKPAHINIHSDHPEGKKLMRKFAEENFPDSVITMNSAKQ